MIVGGATATGLLAGFGPLAALVALGASFAWEYIWVEAGQAVPVS